MGVLIDETGNRYGRLLVLSRAENHHSGRATWLCKCDCGNETTVMGTALRNGHTQSCGCFHRDRLREIKTIDLTGKVFGRLTVLHGERNRGGHAAWCCRCDCGNETVVRGAILRRGEARSCGCRLPRGEAGFNALLNSIRHSAKKRSYNLELSWEQVHVLTSQPCYYCGIGPSQVMGYGHGQYTYNGIDRMDNGLGYIESNCVPCCKQCNWAKRTNSVQEFKSWATRLYKHFISDR